MNNNYKVEIEFHLSDAFKVEAFYPIANNGCCKKDFFILTTNRYDGWEGGINYSCQCACGIWCTNGHDNPQDAVNEYRKMCENFNKKYRRKK